jgi:hypothetical protein
VLLSSVGSPAIVSPAGQLSQPCLRQTHPSLLPDLRAITAAATTTTTLVLQQLTATAATLITTDNAPPPHISPSSEPASDPFSVIFSPALYARNNDNRLSLFPHLSDTFTSVHGSISERRSSALLHRGSVVYALAGYGAPITHDTIELGLSLPASDSGLLFRFRSLVIHTVCVIAPVATGRVPSCCPLRLRYLGRAPDPGPEPASSIQHPTFTIHHSPFNI